MRSWKIKNIKIDNQIVLAPMAGVTNIAFREVCKEYGCGLIFTEMVSDKAILHRNQKTLEMLRLEQSEHPIAIQLFGGEVESMVEAAKYLDEHSECDIIDINMGCPVNKVVKNKAGSYLMQVPDLAFEIVSKIVKSVKKPVTVKLRAGYDSQHINVIEMAQLMEKAGASALSIHPRTRAQMFTGQADWSLIKQVKEVVKIPIIGNGDIKTSADAKSMLEETGCDAVMIGRGALGKPWLIKQSLNHLQGLNEEELSLKEIKVLILNHLERLCQLKGEKIGVSEIRSHISWYLTGLKNNTKVKQKINTLTTKKEIQDVIEEYFKILEEDR